MSGGDLMAALFGHYVGRQMEHDDAIAAIRSRAAINVVRERAELRRENEWLRTLVRALAEICLEKGLITEQELKERIAKIDAEDAARAKAERGAARAARSKRR